MVKDLLKNLGIEFDEEISDEEAEKLLTDHINNLNSEKDSLSKTNEELVASVEGYKSNEEKLNKELSETTGRLNQLTEMYKEQFSKSEDLDETPKDDKKLGDDVLQAILDTK